MALLFLVIAGGIAWLVNRMARTAEAEYRILVIGAAVALVAAGIAMAGGFQRMRR